MAYTATKLINNAYYTSGIVARNLETVSGQQLADGLVLLNELLDTKASNPVLLPYWTQGSFNAVIGQEEYFIENLLEIEYLTFNIGAIRYSMLEKSRRQYFASGRVDNVQSLPFDWRLEREKGGSRLYLYFLPADAYVMKYHGKFGLTDVAAVTDLETVYDGFYIAYLRYALAKFICDENDIEMTPGKMDRLRQYEKQLISVSPPDLTMQKMSTLRKQRGLNWADVNIGLGWRPL